jgi:hypothetical protein
MVDGLHVLITNRTMKPLATERGRGGGDGGGDPPNVSLFGIVTINLTYTTNISQ